MKFVVCLKTKGLGDFSSDDLTIGRLYEVLEDNDAQDMLRLIDDSGEDYLYPADYFEAIEISIPTAERLHNAVLMAR
jgi:hypothetical protein